MRLKVPTSPKNKKYPQSKQGDTKPSTPRIWRSEALPVAKVSFGSSILHIRGDAEVLQMAVSVGSFADVYDMRLPPARSLMFRAAVPLDETRYLWMDKSGASHI